MIKIVIPHSHILKELIVLNVIIVSFLGIMIRKQKEKEKKEKKIHSRSRKQLQYCYDLRAAKEMNKVEINSMNKI